MKKLFLTAVAGLTGVVAFGQGKLEFNNDSLHLVYYDSTMGSLAGQPVSPANMLPYNFLADLYAGTSSGSLSYASSTTFSALSPGRWNDVNVTFNSPFIPVGTTVYLVVQVRDSLSAPPATWTPATSGLGLIGPFGYSVEFTHTLGSSITYPFMTDTWPTGTFPIPGYGLGAIPVGLIPEPSTLALAGLGAVVIGLWGRERKRER